MLKNRAVVSKLSHEYSSSHQIYWLKVYLIECAGEVVVLPFILVLFSFASTCWRTIMTGSMVEKSKLLANDEPYR